jgi:hypothetical protein
LKEIDEKVALLVGRHLRADNDTDGFVIEGHFHLAPPEFHILAAASA